MLHFNGDVSKVKFYQNTHGRVFVKLTDGTMIEGAIEYRLVLSACSCQRHTQDAIFFYLLSLVGSIGNNEPQSTAFIEIA